MMRILGLIIKAVFVAYLVIFSVNNFQVVQFKPFMNVAAYQVPLFLLIIISMFIGLVLGALAMVPEKLSLQGQIKRLSKEMKGKDDEIERLKKLTVSNTEVTAPEMAEAEKNEPQPADSEIKDILR